MLQLYCIAVDFLPAGVPIKLLHEGVGQTVLVALKNGEEYRGTLLEAEDTMNCQLKEGESESSFAQTVSLPVVFVSKCAIL